MSSSNFPAFLSFVWQPNYDSPAQGYHVTPGDSGGGTYGGVIETTWAGAVARGMVTGVLRNATRNQLSLVLRDEFWGSVCDALPSGIDLMLGNGRMMTGAYPKIFQRCLGLTGSDVDGNIGDETLRVAQQADATTLISALTGAHYAYLANLRTWSEFGAGWTTRISAARNAALALLMAK